MSSIKLVTPVPGPKSQEILARRNAALPAGAGRATEVVVQSAEGALIHDIDGNTFIDLAGGIGIANVGHAPEAVVNAMKAQLDKYIHTCAIVTTNEPMIELAEMLKEVTPGDFPKKVMYANSGAEVVEMAINVAKYATKRPGVICFEGAYHGRTLMAMTLTSKYGLFKKGFGPFAPDVYRIPAPNFYRKPEGLTDEQYVDYLCKNVDNALMSHVDPSAVAAIIIEPVQGEGGFLAMPKAFLQKLRDVCDQHGIVLIFDEIQSGMGRTGKLFASEHTGVVPDLTTTAKSLGAGMPIAALVGKSELMDAPHIGGVGGTYYGNPVVCAAAIESLKMIKSPEFLAKGTALGVKMRSVLESWKEKYSLIGDVRGLGPMMVVEFVKDRSTKEPAPEMTLEIIKDASQNGLVLLRAGLFTNCIRFLPPIVITDEQFQEAMDVLEAAIARAHERHAA
jgi:4-aminobutyrate aminotransferase / (S)-3-amino-2-methylpropionate transaminase / 5-aminovalerate transaminase